MHDINPLATTMHLKELERRSTPTWRAVPSRAPASRHRSWIKAGLARLLQRVWPDHPSTKRLVGVQAQGDHCLHPASLGDVAASPTAGTKSML
jgi:hypothetical protein